MDDVLQDEVLDTPAVEVAAEVTDQTAEVTGEVAIETPPVETPEQKRSKGQEAAIIAERRRRQELEQELQQYRSQAKPQPVASSEMPQREQYQSDEQYWQAVGLHAAQQRFTELQQEQQAAQQARTQQEHMQQVQKVADARVSAGQAKYQDFDSVINNGLAPFLTQELHETILSSEVGHEVAYYLRKNPAEAARIADLPTRAMVREMTLLEIKLKDAPAATAQAIPQTLTQTRNAQGRFDAPQSGPTPLDAILAPQKR